MRDSGRHVRLKPPQAGKISFTRYNRPRLPVAFSNSLETVMAGFLRAYNSALARRPLLTQCSTAAGLFATGDILAQQAIEKRKYHDYARTARLAIYGGAIFAPVMARWYVMLERVKMANPTAQLATRVALDQFALTPVIVAVFFSSQTLMEGKSLEDVKRRLQTSWQPTLIRNWAVWIPVQIANFSLVPLQLRLLVVNVVALFWNCYLSYANAQANSALPATLT